MAPGDGGHEKTLWIYSILDGSGDAFDVSDPEFVLADPVNRILPLPGILSVLLLSEQACAKWMGIDSFGSGFFTGKFDMISGKSK